MAKKALLQDENKIEILPITRGELVLDSSGKLALHSNEFLATDTLPGLMSKEDKQKLKNIIIDSDLSTTSTNPVQNKVVTNAINSIKTSYLKSATVSTNTLTIVDQSNKETKFYNTTYGVVTQAANGLAPKIGTDASATIRTQADEWVLTSTKGAQPTWRKLPVNAFKNDNTTYTFTSGNGSFTVTTSGGTALTVSIGKPATAGNADTSNRTKFLETFYHNSTTNTYGSQYPIWALWSDNNNVRLKCTNYTVWTDKADNAINAATATKIGTSTVGSASMPVYIKSGTPTAITSFPEAYLSWGGKNFSGSYGPIDAAMIPDLGACRSMFAKAAGITVQYSRDGGLTWIDYGVTDTQKTALFSTGKEIIIGGTTETGIDKSNYKLRVIVTTNLAGIYTTLNKIAIYVTTNGSTGSNVIIDARTKANVDANNDTWVTLAANVTVSGWSGWNIINIPSTTTYGNQSYQYQQIRFTFGVTSHKSTVTYAGLLVHRIMMFGGMGWSAPSNMAKNGHLYSFDQSQNATFPAAITSTKFVKYGGTSSQFLKADGSVDSSIYSKSDHTHTFASLTSKPTTISGYGITDGLRRVTLANNIENDFNTFENLTFTGRGDPTTGSSIVNSPWTTQPAGGFGVLTYLWSGYGLQLAAGYYSNDLYIRNRYYSNGGTVWDTKWDKILNSSNYNSYAPKLDGKGATGTWKINISGNAATATTATTATNLSKKPSIQVGTSDTKKVTITAGGKTSDEYIIPFATASDKLYAYTIAAGTDVNTLKDFKYYVSNSTSVCASIINGPIERTNGEMWFLSIPAGASSYGQQLYYSRQATNWQLWTRTWVKNSFSPWVQFIHSGNISSQSVSSATTSTYASNVGSSGTAGTNYVTAANVISMYNWYNSITTTDEASNTAIDKWNEIVSFLAGITDTSTLSGILAGYAAAGHNHDKTYLKLSGGNVTGQTTIRKDLTGNLSDWVSKQHLGPFEVGRATNSMCVAIGVTDDNYGYIQVKGRGISTPGNLVLLPGGGNLTVGNATNTVYHKGNLSIATLMGSTAIGDSDEPVYWNGSKFVKAGAYPTKSSWNYDDRYLKLTGGKITGPVTFEMSNDRKIYINNSDNETYWSLISFQQKGTEYGTLGTAGSTDLQWNGHNLYHAGNLTASVIGSLGTLSNNISGNAATATKLKTPRTIWGQSFDGTTNITGALTEVTDITASGNINCANLKIPSGGKIYNGGWYGLYINGSAGDYGSAIYLTHDHGKNQTAFRIHSHYDNTFGGLSIGFSTTTQNYLASPIDATYSEIVHIRGNGNVGIGTTSPSSKLHVVGDIYTTTGFKKKDSSNSYLLLGGGGHKAISDFLLKSEMANQELSNNLTTITKTLTVTADWMDTGITSKNLATGTYIVQVNVHNSTDIIWDNYWSGVMSWYASSTNDTDTDEIILHRAGHAYGNTIYLRTVMQSSSVLKLQIAANKTLSTAATYTFKFKRVI